MNSHYLRKKLLIAILMIPGILGVTALTSAASAETALGWRTIRAGGGENVVVHTDGSRGELTVSVSGSTTTVRLGAKVRADVLDDGAITTLEWGTKSPDKWVRIEVADGADATITKTAKRYEVTVHGSTTTTTPEPEPEPEPSTIVVAYPSSVTGLVKVDRRLGADEIRRYVDDKGRENAHVGTAIRVTSADGEILAAGSGTSSHVIMDVDTGDEQVSPAWKNDDVTAWYVVLDVPESTDTGSTDTGSTDTGSTDTGSTDTGSTDDATGDSGSTDSSYSQDPSGTAVFPAKHETYYPMGDQARTGFISTCGFIKADTVDPIVFPGSTTKSHQHDFFGNASIDAHTTSDSLIKAGKTSCIHADDYAAYWTPSAYDGGAKARVMGTSMYYFTDKVDSSKLKAIPTGLRVIAGDAKATGPQPWYVASFEEHRNAKNNTRDGRSEMITATQSGQVTVRINFPQCWDGKNLDSPDHKSHMAYASNGIGGTCPASHPVLLPQLTMFVRYDADGGSNFELSSGAAWYTAHADFWNAWHPDTFKEILDTCRNQHCGRISSK